jgi:serine/threonine protein kinase
MVFDVGFGEIFFGLWLGQEIAIKQYRRAKTQRLGAEFDDFMKEVNVISSLRHPNIVLYMGVSVYRKRLWMITEYMEGGSLFDLLHTKNIRLKDEEILQISEDIAKGMAHLHSRGVLHCDLKSSNILVNVFRANFLTHSLPHIHQPQIHHSLSSLLFFYDNSNTYSSLSYL